MGNQIKPGEFRIVTRLVDPPVLLEITAVVNKSQSNYLTGNCVLTGDEWIHGLYNENQYERVGPPLCEMEVLAWTANQ